MIQKEGIRDMVALLTPLVKFLGSDRGLIYAQAVQIYGTSRLL